MFLFVKLGMRRGCGMKGSFALTPVSSTGQALSHDGRGSSTVVRQRQGGFETRPYNIASIQRLLND